MRLRVAISYNRFILTLFFHSITQLQAEFTTADQLNNKNDNRKSSSGSNNSLMDAMMKKYSYPKNEVTAGVGYGHHLHPFYYRGEKEIMYPCAVECGEWETMNVDDNAYDASSNVDVVTVRPDVSKIDITTAKSRPYKDISLLRPKKYRSKLFSGGEKTAETSKTSTRSKLNGYHPKNADIQISEESDTTEQPNDGSLYAKYQDALVSGYGGDNSENKEYFDPLEESMGYNPPSFDEAGNDDVDATVYPTKLGSNAERGRIEEKYVKHNIREERLEDVRSNSFGPSGEGENYVTDAKQPSSSYDRPKYIDDYAAPIETYDSYSQDESGEPFRPSPPQGQFATQKLQPFYKNQWNTKIPQQDSAGYSDYAAEDDYEEHPVKSSYYGPAKGINYGKRHPRGRTSLLKMRRPPVYGRNQKYYPIHAVGNRHRAPYPRSLYTENGMSYPYRPYAPRHGYSAQNQEPPLRLNPGGIRVVPPPKIRHGRFLRSNNGVRTSPYGRGQKISYRRTIPQRNGFTKIVKNYRTFVDHTPKRYVGSD